MTTIRTKQLTLENMPASDASDIEIIRFAQTLNGYDEVGGEAAELGTYANRLAAQPLESLSLNDLRILLFARQRAHYFEGGGWGDDDPIMDEMRVLTDAISRRMAKAS